MDSSIFKASPLHKLTKEQHLAKEHIIKQILDLLLINKKGQLVFIEGEAETGKTVLNSSIFYELYCMVTSPDENNPTFYNKNSKCCLIVNNKEQGTVYKQICKKLCIDKVKNLVYSATEFIHAHSINDTVDIVFVDEAYLLLTQGKQSYRGKNQLQDILDRAKVVVIMFDPNQILKVEQYWEYELLEKYKSQAEKNHNYIVLKEQLRMRANKEVIAWIDDFSKNGIVNKLPKEMGDYEIKIFDTPELLEQAIKRKAKTNNARLSRLVATYDWPYSEKRTNSGKKWEVVIGKWHKPWNYELGRNFNHAEKRKQLDMSWAEQPHTIEEIGSIYTIQGFDLNYVGLIIGPSVKWENNQIVFHPELYCNSRATVKRKLSNGIYKSFAEQLLKNQLRVLMTRGINGLYIYACDEKLREHLKEL